jgi:hypothetical protein
VAPGGGRADLVTVVARRAVIATEGLVTEKHTAGCCV